MQKIKVLFVCIHNSARSQMAEAYLNLFAGDKFEAESAGLEPGILNPLVVEVMKEEGIDISMKVTNDVFDFYKKGKFYSYVITVCDREAAERCPLFPGVGETINWSFNDPSEIKGPLEERLEGTRKIRDQIKERINDWISELKIKSDS